jgi:tetratricopeptide (TPR) repeat protein
MVLLVIASIVWFSRPTEVDYRKRIAEAEKERRWDEASSLWYGFEGDFPDRLSASDFVRWARSELVLDRPAKAQALLDRWRRADDRNSEGWQLSIELRRALGDADGVNRLVRESLREPEARRSPGLLTVSTFGLLTVMDPVESRARLERWAKAEPDSPLARAWILQRSLEEVDATGQNGVETLQQARDLVRTWPGDSETRRVLVEALFVQGEYEEIRREMANWPEDDSRESIAWLRLEGRRRLEIENDPKSAIPFFESVVARMPQDWRSRYRLSRALAGANRVEEARKEATRTVEIRELLEPAGLERILKEAFPQGKPPNPEKLNTLLRKIDQVELAQAWGEWQKAEKLISSLK